MQTIDGNWSYDYDGGGQLIYTAFTSRNVAISNQELRYNYDEVGNRVSTVVNGGTTNYLANNLNQYKSIGGTALQYDADGNLSFDGIRTYAYDSRNHLVSVAGPEGVTDYEYDALGNRTATVFNGQRTEYLLDPTGFVSVVGELDGTGAVKSQYVHGYGLVELLRPTGEHFMYDFDALGSTSSLTDKSGVQLSRYSYLPFGETYSLVGKGIANPFQFAGRFGVTHEENGLDFMRARFFSERLGSFLSVDSIRLRSGDFNFYRYAGNSPTRLVDPLGLQVADEDLELDGVPIGDIGVGNDDVTDHWLRHPFEQPKPTPRTPFSPTGPGCSAQGLSPNLTPWWQLPGAFVPEGPTWRATQ